MFLSDRQLTQVHERSMTTPRGLSRQEAAEYTGCRTLSAFSDRIRRGVLPGPIPGTHSWDRVALDRALDLASGLQPSNPTSYLQAWRDKRARASQGHSPGQ